MSTNVLVIAQGEAKCVCIFGWEGLHDERGSNRMRVNLLLKHPEAFRTDRGQNTALKLLLKTH